MLQTFRSVTLLKRDSNTGFSLGILQNLYFEDHLQAAASASRSILCKEFVDISYENASFGIGEESVSLQLIYFLTTSASWPMKYLFRILCVVFIAQISHYRKFMALHKLISIVLQLTIQIK